MFFNATNSPALVVVVVVAQAQASSTTCLSEV
jgi:hypothetical protein